MRNREQRCIVCDVELPFETPPCTDGHDDECPELLCTRCGAAEIVAPVTIRMLLSPGGSRVAPQQRRAA